MEKLWINNSPNDRIFMLDEADKTHPGIGQQVIEKDWWVAVTLKALFQTECKDALIFKGGTSLSKGWGLIERFSEDIDLAISHHFFGIEKTTKSQRDKLRKKARAYILETLSAQLDEKLKKMGVSGFTIEPLTHFKNKNGEIVPYDSDKDPSVLLLHYDSLLPKRIDYVEPSVKIEISCLSMDEPVEDREITSLISDNYPEDDADSACKIRTVVPTRTFLEKIFLLAEEFQKDRPRSLRMSRHLYDIERIMDTDFGKAALNDTELYKAIVNHRRAYYALKYVNYDLLSPDVINIIPPSNVIDDWHSDYENMQKSFIYGASKPFDELINRISKLQNSLHLQARI